jgi:hypothetical protein
VQIYSNGYGGEGGGYGGHGGGYGRWGGDGEVPTRQGDEGMVFITSYNPVSLTIIAQVQGCHVPRPITAFDEVGFLEYLMLSIRAQGFPSPTPVQCQGWPMALSGRYMVAIAQTGSGKTIVFALPAMLHTMRT